MIKKKKKIERKKMCVCEREREMREYVNRCKILYCGQYTIEKCDRPVVIQLTHG